MHIKLGLDRMKCILRFHNLSHIRLGNPNDVDAFIYGAGLEVAQSHNQFLRKGAWNRPHRSHSLMESFYPLEGGSYLSMNVGCTRTKVHYITLQFNAGKMNQRDWRDFCMVMGLFLPSAYVSLFSRAATSAVEVPLDVFGVARDDYLFFDTRVRSHDMSYDDEGTLYLGSKHSAHYVCIYDKAKQRRDKGIPYEGQWLRIEPCDQSGVAMKDLAGIPSPFDSLWVIEKARLRNAIGRESAFFRTAVLDHGLSAQVTYEMCDRKKALLQELEQCAATWYDRKRIWEQFPHVVHGISPAGLEEAMGIEHDIAPGGRL